MYPLEQPRLSPTWLRHWMSSRPYPPSFQNIIFRDNLDSNYYCFIFFVSRLIRLSFSQIITTIRWSPTSHIDRLVIKVIELTLVALVVKQFAARTVGRHQHHFGNEERAIFDVTGSLDVEALDGERLTEELTHLVLHVHNSVPLVARHTHGWSDPEKLQQQPRFCVNALKGFLNIGPIDLRLRPILCYSVDLQEL